MAQKKRRTSRTTATTRAIAKAGHRLRAALARAQKTSERAASSASRALEQLGGDVSALPTAELRRIVEQSFKSAEEVLQAQRSFALGLIDAIESGARKTARPTRPAHAKVTAVAEPVRHRAAS